MAGLLDLISARIAPAYYNRQMQERDAQNYQALIADYQKAQYQPQDAQAAQYGPTPGQTVPGRAGLLDPETRQQFFLKASAIPGYESLTNQMLSGDQAMNRTKYTNENISAADLMSQQRQWNEYNTVGANFQANLDQQQPYVDAGVAQRYASAGASNASANRTNQGAMFDAQLQPGLLTQQTLTNEGKTLDNRNKGLLGTPEQQEARILAYQLQADTAKATQAATREAATVQGVQQNAVQGVDNLIANIDEFGFELGGIPAAARESLRESLVQALAQIANPGRAPTDADIEAAGRRVPEVGVIWGKNPKSAKAALLQLKRDLAGFKPLPPAGFVED